ncbi:MAG: hypothetical protein KAR35_04640 [Candidatus Heimdallarchaeota archaeon]|nr:hypothetical protein [Candidatus Heimdallarchaeota archaeon]MCK5048643.1 hypothetical protein [Candidatus Heimdallarchaeota archaeon]
MNSDLANNQEVISLKSLLKLLATIDKGLSSYLYTDVFDDADSSNLNPVIDYLAKLLSEDTTELNQISNETTDLSSSVEQKRFDRVINHFEDFSSSRLSFRTIISGANGETPLIGKKGSLAYKSFSLVISSCWIFHFREFEKLVTHSEDIYARIEAYEALKLIPRITDLIDQIKSMEEDLMFFSWGADISELNKMLLKLIKSNDQVITSAKIVLGKKIEETAELCNIMSLPCKGDNSSVNNDSTYTGLELINKVAILRSFGSWTEHSTICLSEVFDELIELVERLEGYTELKEYVNYEQELDFLAYQPVPMSSRELIQASSLDPLSSDKRIISGEELPQLISVDAMSELDLVNHPEKYELVLSVEVIDYSFMLNVIPSIYEKELIIGETEPFHCNHSLTLPWISLKNDLLVFLGDATKQTYNQTLFLRNYSLSIVSEILTYAIKEANTVNISAIRVIIPKEITLPSEIELLEEMSGLSRENIKKLGDAILNELEHQVVFQEIFEIVRLDRDLINN